MRRVVITGMGTVNPLGKNVEEFWENIKANKNGLSYVDQFDTENFPVKIVGAVKDVFVITNRRFRLRFCSQYLRCLLCKAGS